MKAYLYNPLGEGQVQCNLCSHRCKISLGKRGICRVRENREGALNTLVYGKLVAEHVDPIEKKPLFHFLPGTLSYSIATVGCNFKCDFCQNADIAQMPADRHLIMGRDTSPEEVVESALKAGAKSISYTYNEPTVFFEFALDTAKVAHARGLKNVFVTNGYMTEEALAMIAPYLDAANVDLKGWSDKFYARHCGAKVAPVRETLVRMKALSIFLEVTTLIIPGLNDDPDELAALAAFIADDLGADTPWHISRFHPAYKLTDIRSTPLNTLEMARKTGIKAGLRYIYTGNVPGNTGENTFCHNCGKTLIGRRGFEVMENHIKDARCPVCAADIEGVGL